MDIQNNTKSEFVSNDLDYAWAGVVIKSEPPEPPKCLEHDSVDQTNFQEENSKLTNLSNKVKKGTSTLKLKSAKQQRINWCHECQKEFKSLKGLNIHLKCHANRNAANKGKNPEDKLFYCEVCKASYQTQMKLLKHVKVQHAKVHLRHERFECDYCKKTFTNRQSMKLHIAAHMAGGGPYKCTICAKAFVRSYSLKVHLLYHSEDKPFQCKLCNQGFYRNNDYQAHILVHENKKPFACDVCNKAFLRMSYLNNHKKIHLKDRPHVCKTCGKRFIRVYDLTIHMRYHTGEKRFECDICHKKFKKYQTMKVHILVHMGFSKSFKCTVCSKQFSRSNYLKEHLQGHSGYRPHECEVCKKTFVKKYTLNSHMLIHQKIKPYVCEICGRGFVKSYYLTSHKRMHSDLKADRPFQCDVCQKSFTCASKLKVHKRSHTGVKPFDCEFCQRKFKYENSLKAHKVTHKNPNNVHPEKSPTFKTNFEYTMFRTVYLNSYHSGKYPGNISEQTMVEIIPITVQDIDLRSEMQKNAGSTTSLEKTTEPENSNLIFVKNEFSDRISSTCEIDVEDVKVELKDFETKFVMKDKV